MRPGFGSLAIMVALAVAGCTALPSGAPSGSKPTDSPAACRTAKSAKDCGGMRNLVEAARDEGSVVVAGDPETTPPLKQIAAAFTKEYGVKVQWVMPGASTEEQLRLGAKPYQHWPDIFILDPSAEPPPADRVVPYQVVDFARISASNKDPQGLWVHDYAGVMAIGYDAGTLGDVDSLQELVSQADIAKVSLPGDPRTSASTAHALLMLDAVASPSAAQGAGLTYLQQLGSEGVLATDYSNLKSMRHRQQNVALDWNYMQEFYVRRLKPHDIRWKYFVPPGGEIVASHGLAINAIAYNPAAARLWEEFMFTGRIQELLSEGGAMPTLFQYLQSTGDIGPAAGAKQPLLVSPPRTPTAAELEDARTRAAAAWDRLFKDG